MIEGASMAGYDPNRPRPKDDRSLVGLPGDPAPEEVPANPLPNEMRVTSSVEDENEPTLQSIPRAVDPLDRRVPVMVIAGGLSGFAILLIIWRRVLRNRQ
tara:strand:+ start:476 stop:775 length:300 start_codon:yes stop_codon:yes gene_type:complete